MKRAKSYISNIAMKFRNNALVRDTSGLAIIEFAYTAPLMLMVGMTGMETANLAIAHLQVSQIAMLAADNASRARESIDEADIREIFTGVSITGDSFNFSDNARVILSSFEHNGKSGSDEGFWIRWQRCYGANTAYSSSYGVENDTSENSPGSPLSYNVDLESGMGPVGKKITTPSATGVNFVEVVYDYQPLISDRFFGNKVIRYESAFVARERDDHALKNASSISSGDLWTCDRYATIS